jgi:hypothetical protein
MKADVHGLDLKFRPADETGLVPEAAVGLEYGEGPLVTQSGHLLNGKIRPIIATSEISRAPITRCWNYPPLCPPAPP